MRALVALVIGALFGAGLAVSQMVNPEKVLAFLDIAAIASGGWDPSLAVVMAAALAVSAPAFALARRRGRAVFGDMQLPTRRDIDRPLALGAVLFGIGWGLAGYCPGPAIAGLAYGVGQTALFVVAMVAGMAVYRVTAR